MTPPTKAEEGKCAVCDHVHSGRCRFWFEKVKVRCDCQESMTQAELVPPARVPDTKERAGCRCYDPMCACNCYRQGRPRENCIHDAPKASEERCGTCGGTRNDGKRHHDGYSDHPFVQPKAGEEKGYPWMNEGRIEAYVKASEQGTEKSFLAHHEEHCCSEDGDDPCGADADCIENWIRAGFRDGKAESASALSACEEKLRKAEAENAGLKQGVLELADSVAAAEAKLAEAIEERDLARTGVLENAIGRIDAEARLAEAVGLLREIEGYDEDDENEDGNAEIAQGIWKRVREFLSRLSSHARPAQKEDRYECADCRVHASVIYESDKRRCKECHERRQ